MGSLGCATAEVSPISVAQAKSFQSVVAQAKRVGGDEPFSPAQAMLRAAESDFYYAEHLPRDPERARQLAAAAQAEADTALRLAEKKPDTKVAASDSTEAP
ncbi:MAG: hypothetical protein JWM82_550 [Myxococcales bacterium]|nr:hypothetical protein [Myxococcales bacterium]